MKRLTKHYDDGRAYLCIKTKAKGHEGTAEAQTKAINRLAELEDKLESGLLIEIPCKMDDNVYYITPLGGNPIIACTQLANLKGYQIRKPEEYGYYVDVNKAEEELKKLKGE